MSLGPFSEGICFNRSAGEAAHKTIYLLTALSSTDAASLSQQEMGGAGVTARVTAWTRCQVRQQQLPS